MKATITSSGVKIIPISQVFPYPSNARRGDLTVLKESLSAHGQYRPIVVQASTGFILAGNHTYKAMKELGLKKIKVVMVDVDDAKARKIVLADNRMTDLADTNEVLLKALLDALPDLEGTGFSETDKNMLESMLDPKEISARETTEKDPEVRISAWRFTVNQEFFDSWKEEMRAVVGKSRMDAVTEIKRRLVIPEPPPVPPLPPEADVITSVEGADVVDIKEIFAHPFNPREGDVGAIMGSLETLGQYRPIVVNKRTMRCLSGNHTLQAMASLGWEKVAVSWVDVDDEGEIKILIVDNRSSDLATYDSHALQSLLKANNLGGTGFTEEDMVSIMAGGKSQPRYSPAGRSSVSVGEYKFRVRTEDLISWANTIYGWSDVAELLGFAIDACTSDDKSI